MSLLFGIILGLFILMLLVTLHELGHAVAARRYGVVVEEFGIGFPPRAIKKKLKNGTVFSLNWLPLGGFVKLQGENDEANKKGDYGTVTFVQKTKILLAGVVTNWLIAVILLSGLALVGLPKILPNQVTIPSDTIIVSQPIEITSIKKGYPAEKAGLQIGDKIIRFAGQQTPTASRLIEISKQDKGKKIEVIYDRKGTEHNVQVELKSNVQSEYFGAGLGQRELIKATWSAPVIGAATTVQYTWLTLQSVGELIGSLAKGLILQINLDQNARNLASQELKKVSDNVAGPIGILGTIFPAAQQAGLTQIIFLTAIISLTLAVMNILPIPSLDGGTWFTTAFFKLFKKKLTKEREEKIQTIGFIFLVVLIIMVTIADVTKLF